jgi:hypothetical protein
MKRLWIAITFLAIAVGLCTSEQIFIKNVYNTINQYVDSADVEGLQEYWDKNNNLIFSFSEHSVLDDLSQKIEELNPNDEEIKSALTEVRALNKVYYENQRISLSNIF